MPEIARSIITETGLNEQELLRNIESYRDLVLANLILISQEPAQTFHEKARAQLVLDRFIESGLRETRADEIDNVIGIIPGTNPSRRMLLFAHMDHQFEQTADQDIIIDAERAFGRGIANDTSGLAVLTALPGLINKLELEFSSDIVLLATTRAHGRGDFEGIRTFMNENHNQVDVAFNISGTPLGKVDYFCLSRVRCDIRIEMPDAHSTKTWGTFGQTSAIRAANEIMSQLYSIPLPSNPQTVLNIGMINGGEAYSTVSSDAVVSLELLSENDKTTGIIQEEICDRCIDLEAKHGLTIRPDFFSRHHGAGLSFSHPLVKTATSIIKHVGFQPLMEYSTSEITVPLAMGIPSLNIGVTTGKRANSPRGYIDLPPLPQGLLQIIMLLFAVDRGVCDE